MTHGRRITAGLDSGSFKDPVLSESSGAREQGTLSVYTAVHLQTHVMHTSHTTRDAYITYTLEKEKKSTFLGSKTCSQLICNDRLYLTDLITGYFSQAHPGFYNMYYINIYTNFSFFFFLRQALAKWSE